MNKIIKTLTIDSKRKNLYSKALKKKIINKSVYIYIYIPIRKANQLSKIESKLGNNLNNLKLVSLFSKYTFFPTYLIQGPRIYMLITKSLFFEKIKELQETAVFICFFELKWYAFFLFLEVNLKYQNLFNLCFNLKSKIEVSSLLLLPYQK